MLRSGYKELVVRPLARPSTQYFNRALGVHLHRSFGLSRSISRGFVKPLQFNRYSSSDVEQFKKDSDFDTLTNTTSLTGVVDVQKGKEILLYFDHIYPRSVSKVRIFNYLNFFIPDLKTPEQLRKEVMELSSSEELPLPEDAKILDVIPVKRDGGAFVKFSVPEGLTSKELVNQICGNFQKYKDKKTSGYLLGLFHRVINRLPLAYEVKGTPWIEDLRRFPSQRLKVQYEGNPLTEEELYVLFRRYGKILDLEPQNKTTPYATVNFLGIRSAISAKNCITGLILNGGETSLHLQYIPTKKVNYLTEFVSNHQRIAVPIFLALFATIAVLIFDPIRQFFIEEKISHKYSFTISGDNKYLKFVSSPLFKVQAWFCSSYDYIGETLNTKCHEDIISNESDLDESEELTGNSLWTERNEKIKQLKLWIYENINTFIIVKGPKGSGKRELVVEDTLMSDAELRKKVLFIDCESIVKARSERKLIEDLANQLGYFPVFSWLGSVSQFIDLGVQSITGQKSGLSESKETQVKNMFLLTNQAVRSVALNDYNQYKKEVSRKRKRQEHRKRQNPELDIKLEEVMREEEYLQQHPEAKPIIVINKFVSKADNPNDFIYKMVSDWSASLIQANLAHVIYIITDVGSVLQLNNSLPNQVFKTITLNDASEAGGYQYVMNHIRDLKYESIDGNVIKKSLAPLGGRLLDLQSFIRRLRSGETPHEALDELVTQAAEQITTFFLYNNTKAENYDFKNWQPTHVWELIKLLVKSDTIKFSDLTQKSVLFKSDNDTLATLSALEKNDLITLKREKGMLNAITIGRPIYKAAFQALIEDVEIYKSFEINHYNNLITMETNKIHKLEQEMKDLDFKGLNLKNRMKYLVDKVEASNDKVVSYETTIADLKTMTDAKPSLSFLGVFH